MVRMNVSEGETSAGWIADCKRGRAMKGLPIGRVKVLAHC
jgi:hypothetical protein